MGAGKYYFPGENMTTIKRTSPGPKIGPTGSTIGAPKGVGTTGPRPTNKSTDGGQYPFLPSPSAKKGEIDSKPGQTADDNKLTYDFLPKKAGGK
jgi:hypothetical protein